MPQIPQYNRTVKPTTQSPFANRDVGLAGSTGQAITGAGQVIGQVGERMEKVEKTRQLNKAKLQTSKWTNQVRLDSSQNPDKWSIERYNKEANKARNTILSEIKDPQLKSEYNLKLQQDIGLNRLRVFNNVEKYRLKETLATGLGTIEELAEDIATEPNKKVRDQKKEEIDSIVRDLAGAGALDAVQAKKVKDNLFKELGVRRAERDLSSLGSTETLARLKDGEYDVTAQQKKDLRTKLLKIQKKEVELAKEQDEKIKDTETMALIERYIQGEDIAVDADNLKDTDRSHPEVMDAVVRANLSEKTVKAETSGDIYTDLSERIFNLEDNDKGKAREILIEAFNAHAEGKLTKEDVGQLVELNKLFFKMSLEPSMWKEMKRHYGKMLGWMTKYYPGAMATKWGFNAIKSFFDKTLGEKKKPEQAREEALDESIDEQYKGYNREDLEHTMEKHNMGSIDEVVNALEAMEK